MFKVSFPEAYDRVMRKDDDPDAPPPDEGPPRLEEKIPALVARAQPQRVLAVGPLAQALLSPELPPGTELTTLPSAGAETMVADRGHQDMAVVAGDLQALGATGAARLLAQLRDLYAGWVIVVTEQATPPPGLSRRELVGLGFSLLGEATYHGQSVWVYEFDMATYKTTPDWLNSRYWANPELWDKYRW